MISQESHGLSHPVGLRRRRPVVRAVRAARAARAVRATKPGAFFLRIGDGFGRGNAGYITPGKLWDCNGIPSIEW